VHSLHEEWQCGSSQITLGFHVSVIISFHIYVIAAAAASTTTTSSTAILHLSGFGPGLPG